MAKFKVLMVESSWFHCLFLVHVFENEQLILNGTISGIGIASG